MFVLTQNSYEKHVSEGGHFVKFYAPWCPHCKNMVGIWDDLAAVYNTEESKVSIAKVGFLDSFYNSRILPLGNGSYIFIRNGDIRVFVFSLVLWCGKLSQYSKDTQLLFLNENDD